MPVSTFSRPRRRLAAAAEAERVAREALEPIDTDDERALLLSGDSTLVAPGVFLSTIGARMERIDLEPTIAWVPEDLTPEVEGVAMFAHLGLGELVVTETAWHARRVLTASTVIATWPTSTRSGCSQSGWPSCSGSPSRAGCRTGRTAIADARHTGSAGDMPPHQGSCSSPVTRSTTLRWGGDVRPGAITGVVATSMS